MGPNKIVGNAHFGRCFLPSSFTKLMRALIYPLLSNQLQQKKPSGRDRKTYELSLAAGVDVGVRTELLSCLN